MGTRREFLTGALSAASAGALLSQAKPASAAPPKRKTDGKVSTTSICPYCGVGCGIVVSAKDGKVVNIEGDPDHPINEGSLCSKGMALYQIATSDRRLTKVLYRPAGGDRWEERTWDWGIPEIATRIKATRASTFAETEGGKTVNRTTGIACLGGAALDTEECYLYSKLARALGVVYLEHQARI